MTDKELDQIIESLLFASSEPLSQTILNKVFDSSPPSLKESIERLNVTILSQPFEFVKI